MRTPLSLVFGSLIALLMIAGPIGYKRWHDREYRNFHVVQDGVLYRSGQLPLPRLQQMVTNLGIRTVICLREGNDPADQREEEWIKAKMLKFVRIPYRQWSPDETGKVPADESVKAFRKVMDDPANYPVLVHCFAGIHRTGTMCAIYRMDYQDWTNDEAMAEMRVMGYTVLDDHEDILGYLTKYRSPRDAKTLPSVPVSLKKNPLP